MQKKKQKPMEEKEELVLNLVDDRVYNDCLNVLNSNFTSSVLQDMIGLLRRWLSNKKVLYIADNGEKKSYLAVSSYFVMKSHCKDDALRFLAVFFADAQNCSLMIDVFPEIVREVLRRCTDELFLSADEVSKYKNDNLIFSKSKEWGNSRYKSATPWFSIIDQVDNNSTRTTYLWINKSLFPYFYQAFHYKDKDQAMKILPENENLKILRTEDTVSKYFPLVQDLYDQGEIGINQKGKVPSSAVKRCVQYIGDFEEFFPETNVTALKHFRLSLFLVYLCYRFNNSYLKTSRKAVCIESILKDVHNSLLPPARILFNELLPHISGGFSQLDLTNAHYLLLDILADLVENNLSREDGWFSIDDIVRHVFSKERGYVHFLLFSAYDFSYDRIRLKNSKIDKKIIPFSRFRSDLGIPYVKALFLMMASAGLFDIAYRDSLEEDRSWVDWLKYVRLTNLGKYILGISNKYVPVRHNEKVKYYEIDSEHLIVRSLMDRSPFDLFLEDVSKSIGSRRYIFTQESFVKKCSTKNEVQKKIDFFVNHISSELPPLWKDYFDSIISKCDPFVALRPMEYSMFQVNPENKALIHLLSSDPVLKKMVIRAEGFVFMIKNKDSKDFNDRMKAWGYII